MESFVYYPTFEPPNENWLKFSLLYLDEFRPIIPYEKKDHVSDNFKRIQHNTDLIKIYTPDYMVGYRASLRAIDEAQKILNHTYERSYLFNRHNLNLIWRDPSNWIFEIYHQKYAHEWVYFCLNNNLGEETNEGIRVAEELAFLFMTELAKEISYETSTSIITDNNKFDNYTNYQRVFNRQHEQMHSFAKSVIQLKAPKNLNEISFDSLIEFRMRNKDLLNSFNSELRRVQERISSGYTAQNFVDSFNIINSELVRELTQFGFVLLTIPFVTYLLINNHDTLTQEYIKETLETIGGIYAGSYGIKKVLFDNRTGKYCKKYLTNLSMLK